jgi:hypothetical protein
LETKFPEGNLEPSKPNKVPDSVMRRKYKNLIGKMAINAKIKLAKEEEECLKRLG